MGLSREEDVTEILCCIFDSQSYGSRKKILKSLLLYQFSFRICCLGSFSSNAYLFLRLLFHFDHIYSNNPFLSPPPPTQQPHTVCNLLACLSTAFMIIYVPLCFGAILQFGYYLNEVILLGLSVTVSPGSFALQKMCFSGKVTYSWVCSLCLVCKYLLFFFFFWYATCFLLLPLRQCQFVVVFS